MYDFTFDEYFNDLLSQPLNKENVLLFESPHITAPLLVMSSLLTNELYTFEEDQDEKDILFIDFKKSLLKTHNWLVDFEKKCDPYRLSSKLSKIFAQFATVKFKMTKIKGIYGWIGNTK